jgi:hypothetical protein
MPSTIRVGAIVFLLVLGAFTIESANAQPQNKQLLKVCGAQYGGGIVRPSTIPPVYSFQS